MPLTADDLKAIRSIVAGELDAYTKRVGPILAGWVEAEIAKLRPSVVDALNVAAAELKATREQLSRAAAEDSRDTAAQFGTLRGMVEPLAGRVGGIETRMRSLETHVEPVAQLLREIRAGQNVDLQQGASLRQSLMPGEKLAVTEPPPATVPGGPVPELQTTDAQDPPPDAE